MRVYDTFRRAGCARGVAHRRCLVFLEDGELEVSVCSLQEAVIRLHTGWDRRASHRNDNHAFEIDIILALFIKGQQDIVDDEEAIAGVVHDMREIFWSEPQVERVHHTPDGRNTE